MLDPEKDNRSVLCCLEYVLLYHISVTHILYIITGYPSIIWNIHIWNLSTFYPSALALAYFSRNSSKWRACSQANSRLSLHPFKLLWMHCLDLSFSFFLKYFDELIMQRKPGYFIGIFFLIPPFGSFSQPLICTFNVKIATLQYTWNLK